MDPTLTWRENGDTIDLSIGDAVCEAVANRPAGGVRRLAIGHASFGGSLLSVRTLRAALPPASETYVRGEDWVSTHPADEEWPFRLQLYRSLRPLPRCGSVAVTLTVSVQTSLLDTRPAIAVDSRVEGARFTATDAHATASVRGFNLLVAPHPSDTTECELRVGDEGAASHRFAPPFLEKGVIRRVRFAAIAVPGEAAASRLADAVGEWAEAPLPLTA